MTRSKFLLIALTILFAGSMTVALAEGTATPAPTTQKAELKGEWAIMASQLKFTDEQKDKLTKLIADRDAAVAAWEQANKDKLAKAEADLKAAREAKDEAAAKTAREARQALAADRGKILTKFQEDVQSLLTPEQKTLWAEFTLVRVTKGIMTRHTVKLTDAQEKQIKDMAAETIKKNPDTKPETDAWKTMREDFTKTVVEKVLTDEQRKAFSEPTSRPARERGTRTGGESAPK